MPLSEGVTLCEVQRECPIKSAVRLDRLFTLNLVQPFRAFKSRFGEVGVRGSEADGTGSAIPILMYHSISDAPEPGALPYHRVNTSPSVFKQHMEYLRDHGYRTFSLDAVVSGREPVDGCGAARAGSKAIGDRVPGTEDKLVVLTFDDGFRDFYDEAFPVLKEFGFTATMFLPTGFIADSRRLFRPAGQKIEKGRGGAGFPTAKECLTWDEVRELRQFGISFGSHTVNHPKLVELSWEQIRFEVWQSKADMEERLQMPVRLFCHPYAFPQSQPEYVRGLAGLLREAGYSCCVTTKVGSFSCKKDAFCIKRLPINSCDDTDLFKAKLEGAYDWLGLPQHVYKSMSRWREAARAAWT